MGQPSDQFWGYQPGRGFVSASSQQIYVPTAVVSGPPFTVSAWYSKRTLGVNNAIWGLGTETGTTTHHHTLYSDTSNRLNCRTSDTSGYASVATEPILAGEWIHYAGVWASSASRTAFMKSKKATPNTDNATPGLTMSYTFIGHINGGSTTYANGSLAWLAVWNVALSDNEVFQLAQGIPPWLVRPQSIVSCPDMHTLYDPFLNAAWTNSGSTLAAPARVWVPRRYVYGKAPAAAPASSIPVLMANYRRRRAICS